MVLQFKSLVDDGTTFLLAEKHEAQVLKNILMNTAIVASLYSENERIIYIRIPTTTELSEIHMNEAAQILLNYDHPLDQFMHYETLENIRLRNNHKFNKFSLKNLHQLPRKNSDYFEALQETKTVCVLNSKFTYKNGQREFDMDLVDESESQYESENQEPSAKKPKEGTSDETNTVENEDFQNSSCHQETSENHETPTSCETTDNQQGKECPVEQSATEAPIEEPESGSDDIEIDVVGIDYNEFNDVGDNDPILNVLENKKLGFDKNSLSRKERKLIDLGKAVQNLQIRGRDHTLRGRSVRDNGVWILQECLKKAKQLKQDLGDAASGTVFDNPTTFVEEMTGVCSSTLKKVGKKDFVEKKKETVKTASRKARWKRRAGRIPEFIKEAIRDHLDECWEKNTHVTVNTLLDWAKDILHLQLGRTFFADALHGMGLTYKKKSATPLIEERIDLVIARRKYLHRKYELLNPISGKQAFFGYLDETWFFEGMTTLKGWQTGNTNLYKMAREIRVEERRSGPRKGKDKGRRAIVLAVLTSEGILEDSANILISGLKENDQFMDYHREMNFDSYSEYMDVIIPKLAEEARKRGMVAVLVIDNAPYHCEVIEKIPTKSSSKKVLMDFLRDNNVTFDPKMLKPQIVSIFEDFVRKNGGRQNMKKYVIDEEARSQGVEILRLPPYHCIYNPIELVWAALKFYLKTNCENMKLSEARKCALEWLKNYTAAEAAACIRHVEDLEEETRKKLTEKDNEEMEKERERAEAEDSYNDRNLMEAESDYEGYEYDLDSDDEEDYELEHVVDDSDNSVGYDDDDIEELLRAYNDCESDDST